MKSGIRNESRDHILRDLWLKHGCPEGMTIHVRRTGETIRLINGLHVTLTRVCKACRNEFSAQRENAQFCSARCRVKFHREVQMHRNRQEAEYLLAAIHNEPAPLGGHV